MHFDKGVHFFSVLLQIYVLAWLGNKSLPTSAEYVYFCIFLSLELIEILHITSQTVLKQELSPPAGKL